MTANPPTLSSFKVTVESVIMETTGTGNEQALTYYERCALELKALRNAWLYEWKQLDRDQIQQLFASLFRQTLVRPP